MPHRKEIIEKVKALPACPGIYMMKDMNGKIIYVGKSKSLKNRVPNYFQPPERLDIKTKKLAENIFDFECIYTSSEAEALILENELIKRHTPKYNIKLKDAKSYPYIKITSAKPYPKIFIVRKRQNDNAKYFGPYPSGSAAQQIVKTVQKAFKIASCEKEFIFGTAICRPCLDSHIGQCIAPCTGKISPAEYAEVFGEIELFLKGEYESAIKAMELKMESAAEDLRFEAAARFRDRATALKSLAQKQKIISSPDKEQDVFGLFEGNALSVIAILFIRNGVVIDKEEILFSADEVSDKYSLYDLLERYYTKMEHIPKNIITSFDLGEEAEHELSLAFSEKSGYKVVVHHPEKGEKKAIADMAVANAEEIARLRASAFERDSKVLFKLAEELKLECFPTRIEAYDISNNGQNDIYAGMIVLEDGKLKRSDYRSFQIKSLLGEKQDDYASMKEVIARRIAYLNHEEKDVASFCEYPDLILLDGGKGHVSLIRTLVEEAGLSIPVFGMVKDAFHKTRTLTDGQNEISIAKDQSLFLCLSHSRGSTQIYLF